MRAYILSVLLFPTDMLMIDFAIILIVMIFCCCCRSKEVERKNGGTVVCSNLWTLGWRLANVANVITKGKESE